MPRQNRFVLLLQLASASGLFLEQLKTVYDGHVDIRDNYISTRVICIAERSILIRKRTNNRSGIRNYLIFPRCEKILEQIHDKLIIIEKDNSSLTHTEADLLYVLLIQKSNTPNGSMFSLIYYPM